VKCVCVVATGLLCSFVVQLWAYALDEEGECSIVIQHFQAIRVVYMTMYDLYC